MTPLWKYYINEISEARGDDVENAIVKVSLIILEIEIVIKYCSISSRKNNDREAVSDLGRIKLPRALGQTRHGHQHRFPVEMQLHKGWVC